MRTEKLKLLRHIRRIINRKFGGWKKFILLTVCVCVILYCINSLLSKPGRQIWEVGIEGINVTDNRCGVKCDAGHHSFYIRTGEANTVGPTICFEGEVIVSNELKNFGRGLNVVLINDKTTETADVKTFDTYEEESSLIRYLKKTIPSDFLVMIVSFDDAANGLKEDSRRWLSLYGSSLIHDLTLRDGYIMIGQKGLEEGQAIEFIKKRYRRDFAEVLEIAGCFDIPLGPHRNLQLMLPEVINEKDIKLGEAVYNCGVEKPCERSSIPVSVDTGEADKSPVKICINGHLIFGENLNKGGRGFNIVIVDPVLMHPTMTIHVDTYTYDSTDLEIFLESLIEGDIIIAAVGDDGSRKLHQRTLYTLANSSISGSMKSTTVTDMDKAYLFYVHRFERIWLSYAVRVLLNKLGSGHIQNLKFRDVWYFVGQKGMQGFTTMEQISYSGIDGEWPKRLQKSFCVPRKLEGRKVMPDPEVYRNDERRAFCKKHAGYSELCHPSHVDDIIKPLPVLNKSMKNSPVYSTPIIIIPGLNHNAMVRTFQSLLMQPGIKPELVTVVWDEKFPEHGDLGLVFGFRNRSISGSLKYSEQVLKSLKLTSEMYQNEEFVIVIEEDLIVAPDFLYFLAQCVDVLQADDSLLGVSSWNINGYDDVSGKRDLAYRVEEFPGLGFLIKTKVLKKFLALDNLHQCCNKRSWFNWHVNSALGGEMIIPDVSRVFRQLYQGQDSEQEYIQALFRRPRLTNLEKDIIMLDKKGLTESVYETSIEDSIKKAVVLTPNDITQCYMHEKGSIIKEFNKTDVSIPIVICYKQENQNEFSLLRKLCRCFGLFSSSDAEPRNLHHGIIRFYYMQRNIYLVGSASKYFAFLPEETRKMFSSV